jgi:phosphoenolpyruvate carboxykinase (diphosphate)
LYFELEGEKLMVILPCFYSSNFQPIKQGEEMKKLTEELYFFDLFTEPMKKHMMESITGDGISVCSAKPRLVDGKPTANPRYLQVRPDKTNPKGRYLAELGARLYRRLSVEQPCVFPVAGVLSGRRNNPPDELNGAKIRPLCVYNPLHYQEYTTPCTTKSYLNFSWIMSVA